jgi:hypothetical protein
LNTVLRSLFSRAVPLAALLLTLAVFSLSMSFTIVAQQGAQKKRTQDSGAEKQCADNDVTLRKVNVKIRREGAVVKTRRGYYDK